MPKKSKATTVVPVQQGPRKKRRKGVPPPRHTTHKVRAAWFQSRASYPVREANVEHLITERYRVRTAAPLAVNWTQIGPTNVGGRMTALAGSCEKIIQKRLD